MAVCGDRWEGAEEKVGIRRKERQTMHGIFSETLSHERRLCRRNRFNWASHRQILFARIAISALIAMLSASTALADSIAITNASFESPALATAAYTTNSVPNWTANNIVGAAGYGVYNPDASAFPRTTPFGTGRVPRGNNVVYIDGALNLQQITGATYAAGYRYDLTAKIGHTALLFDFPPYAIDLLAGSSFAAAKLISYTYGQYPGAPGPGGWYTVRLSYVVQSNDPIVGQPIIISLDSNGSSAQEVEFDDIRLTRTAVSAIAPNPANPAILNSSETASPGDVINAQGQNFGTAPQVWMQVVTAATTTLTPTTQITLLSGSSVNAQAQIPSAAAAGLYAVWVKNGAKLSNPVFINKPRVTGLDREDIASAGSFHVYGRNLTRPGGTATLKLVDPATGTASAATIAASGNDAYTLNVTGPAGLTAGTPYLVSVNNGYGGSNGDCLATLMLVARNSGPNYFSLSASWAADLDTTLTGNVYNVKTDTRLTTRAFGDGSHDDRAALQGAIDAAFAAGGGIVYLPAGTYKVSYTSTPMLTLKARVVVQGAGAASTTIKYGAGWPSSGGTGAALDFQQNTCETSGVADLTLTPNLASAARSGQVITGFNMSKIFLKRVTTTAPHNTLFLQGIKNLDIEESTFNVNNANGETPLEIYADDWIVFANNAANYYGGRFYNLNANHLVIDTNHLTRKYTSTQINTSGQIWVSGDSDVNILNNTLDVSGVPAGSHTVQGNDGESIGSETGDIPPTTNADFGTATSGTATTLIDTSKSWPTFTNVFVGQNPSLIVAITEGAGAGQWRYVLSNTSNSVTVDHPWLVVPGAGSTYVLQSWSCTSTLVKGNTLTGNPRGIWMYNGNQDWAVVNNSLTDNEGIFVQTFHWPYTGGGIGTGEGNPWNVYMLSWNLYIADNTVVDSSGFFPSYIVASLTMVPRGDIDAAHHAVIAKLHGAQALGIEMRRNALTAHTPNISNGLIGFGDGIAEVTEGYGVYVDYGNAYASPDSSGIGLLGSVLQGNRASNCDTAFVVGTGVYHTAIWDSVLTAFLNFLRDDVGTDGTTPAAHGSVMTIHN